MFISWSHYFSIIIMSSFKKIHSESIGKDCNHLFEFDDRVSRANFPVRVIYVEGLPCSGKTSAVNILYEMLTAESLTVRIINGEGENHPLGNLVEQLYRGVITQSTYQLIIASEMHHFFDDDLVDVFICHRDFRLIPWVFPRLGGYDGLVEIAAFTKLATPKLGPYWRSATILMKRDDDKLVKDIIKRNQYKESEIYDLETVSRVSKTLERCLNFDSTFSVNRKDKTDIAVDIRNILNTNFAVVCGELLIRKNGGCFGNSLN